MKVSGFTFIRNAVKFDFPIVEVITSALDLVDEFVVNVGKSDDETLALVRGIRSPKVRIVETVWDDTMLKDGKVFGMQQDIALSHCTGDWALLLQGDEVLHEADVPAVRRAMEQYATSPDVMGLVFRMVHFKGDYWSVDPWMYHKATRIVRNTPDIRGGIKSTTDCCDFVVAGRPGIIKSSPWGRLIDARIFHYGWVKDSRVLEEKLRFQISRHDGEKLSSQEIDFQAMVRSRYPTYDILRDYQRSHPQVMQARIREARRLRPRRNRWLNWRFYNEVVRHGFKG
jgi:hypothetical protein